MSYPPCSKCSLTSTHLKVSPEFFHPWIDHDYECPFCCYKAQIILHETLLVGDTNQLDYQRTVDKLTQLEKQRLGLTVMPGSSQDSNEDESIVFTNGLELRP